MYVLSANDLEDMSILGAPVHLFAMKDAYTVCRQISLKGQLNERLNILDCKCM